MATLTVNIDKPPIPTGYTLWVDAVNGDDATGTTGRQDLPYLTIQAAITDASSGSTVRVRPGSYTGPIVLKNGVNIDCDDGVSITAAIDVINTYTVSDGGVAVTCSITGKPKLFLIEGVGPPAGGCLHISNDASDVFVDIESLVADTTDIDIGLFVQGGRLSGSIGSIKTTTYDGVWIESEDAFVNLSIGSIISGDNTIEITACGESQIRVGYMSGNGVNVSVSALSVDVVISAQRCVMIGQSLFQTISGGTIKALVELGQYDAGGGVGFFGLCEGVVLSNTRIFNSTNPISLTPIVNGYQFDGGEITNCLLEGSSDSVTASTSASITANGSKATTAVNSNVTVIGSLQVGTSAATTGQVPIATGRGTWAWGAIPDASETTNGIIEIATAAEVAALNDTTRAVTSANLKSGALIDVTPTYITYTGGSVATTSTSFADVHASAAFTGLAPGFYIGEFFIVYSAAATTTGARFALNGTVTQDYLSYLIGYSTQSGDRSSAQTSNFDGGAAAPSSLATTGNNAVLQFSINVTVTGNIVLRFASEVGGSAITVTSLIGFIRRVS